MRFCLHLLTQALAVFDFFRHGAPPAWWFGFRPDTAAYATLGVACAAAALLLFCAVSRALLFLANRAENPGREFLGSLPGFYSASGSITL